MSLPSFGHRGRSWSATWRQVCLALAWSDWRKAWRRAAAHGLLCPVGHGLSYETIGAVAPFPQVEEASIGHFLIGQSFFEGLPAVVRRFQALIADARKG